MTNATNQLNETEIDSSLSALGITPVNPLLHLFFDSAPFIMGLVEIKNGRIKHLLANSACELAMGRKKGDLNGKSMSETNVSEEEERFWAERYHESKDEGHAVQFSNQAIMCGRKYWMQATVFHVGATKNHSDVFCYICEDVTEKRTLLENLKAERERFQLAVEGASAGLWDWDLLTGRVFYSRQWREILGYSEADFVSDLDAWKNLIHPKDLEHTLAHVDDYLTGRVEEYHLEHRLRRKDGSYQWILAKGACTRDKNGKPVRFTGWLIDIHELRSTVDELKRRDIIIRDQQVKIIASAKMSSLGEMAGGIAHEINNPLAIIALSANQIREAFKVKNVDTKLIEESVSKIEATVKRIGKIVKGLRSFSRSGDNDPFTPCQVEQILSDTLELCKERFISEGVELKIGPTPSRPVECRAVQISQVLLNLLSNALDATKKIPNAWVEIQFDESETGVLFSVTDCGQGIPKQVVPRMMEPFFSTKDVGEGTGLGLSIAKGIIEDHRGHLKYIEDTEHTRFEFQLPYHRQSQKSKGPVEK